MKHSIFGMQIAALAVGIALMLSACSTLSSIQTTVSGLTSAAPASPATVADAVLADDLIATAVSAYANSGAGTAATLTEIDTLRDAVHAAVVSLETSQAQGATSLSFEALAAALAAYRSYAASAGVP